MLISVKKPKFCKAATQPVCGLILPSPLREEFFSFRKLAPKIRGTPGNQRFPTTWEKGPPIPWCQTSGQS